MDDVQAYTEEEVRAISRGKARYALFRRKIGIPDVEHWKIINYYAKRVDRYNLQWSEFGDVWDLSKDNHLDIVSGHIVYLYKEDAKSLFNEDGTLKEQ